MGTVEADGSAGTARFRHRPRTASCSRTDRFQILPAHGRVGCRARSCLALTPASRFCSVVVLDWCVQSRARRSAIYVHLLREVNEAVLAGKQCQLAVLVPPATMQHVERMRLTATSRRCRPSRRALLSGKPSRRGWVFMAGAYLAVGAVLSEVDAASVHLDPGTRGCPRLEAGLPSPRTAPAGKPCAVVERLLGLLGEYASRTETSHWHLRGSSAYALSPTIFASASRGHRHALAIARPRRVASLRRDRRRGEVRTSSIALSPVTFSGMQERPRGTIFSSMTRRQRRSGQGLVVRRSACLLRRG